MMTSIPALSASPLHCPVADPELHPHGFWRPIAIASSTIAGASRAGRNTSTMSTGLGNVAKRSVSRFAEQHLSGDAGVDRE